VLSDVSLQIPVKSKRFRGASNQAVPDVFPKQSGLALAASTTSSEPVRNLPPPGSTANLERHGAGFRTTNGCACAREGPQRGA